MNNPVTNALFLSLDQLMELDAADTEMHRLRRTRYGLVMARNPTYQWGWDLARAIRAIRVAGMGPERGSWVHLLRALDRSALLSSSAYSFSPARLLGYEFRQTSVLKSPPSIAPIPPLLRLAGDVSEEVD